jgi:ribosomal protein L35
MSIKTNKSFSKRLKVTRTGKILSRRGGQNHFNAKESRHGQLASKRLMPFQIKRKMLGHLIPNHA